MNATTLAQLTAGVSAARTRLAPARKNGLPGPTAWHWADAAGREAARRAQVAAQLAEARALAAARTARLDAARARAVAAGFTAASTSTAGRHRLTPAEIVNARLALGDPDPWGA
ncbi:MAG TPA: hypothetical protein VK586_03615 [Streptosporangiaceae bacterium]|nr:hypothetical protein [Streptosporangiaceae bacterium]